jgi:hypothetical protein
VTVPLDPAHLHAAAVRFGPSVSDGSISYSEAYDALCRAAWNNPACQAMPMPAFDDLCGRLADTLAAACDAPALAASQRVRAAMRPLLAHRRSRATVMLAAYRAAADDLLSAEVEEIARQEVALFLNGESRLAG